MPGSAVETADTAENGEVVLSGNRGGASSPNPEIAAG